MVAVYMACVLSSYSSEDGEVMVSWSSFCNFDDFMFFLCWCKCPMVVASDFGKYCFIALTVTPGQVLKWPFFTAFIHVRGAGEKAH